MDDHTPEQEPKIKTGFDILLRRIYRPGPLIVLFLLAFLALASLGYRLLTEEPPPPETIPPVAALAVEPAAADPDKEYEESTFEMEDKVKQADLAIIETMRDLHLKMGELDLVDVELRRHEGHAYHYQVLQLPKVADRTRFLVALRKHLYDRLPDAVLLDNRDTEALIEINKLQTHRLLLETRPDILVRPDITGPRLAVVIDDVGENLGVLHGLAGLDLPLTFAVWPHASHTRECIDVIVRKRRDLIVHFPMEPKGYPDVRPGDDALFVSMSDADIRKQISENLSKIPEAIGVNNHMGSRFTAYAHGMTVALSEFRRHGLFFLDSLTSGKSVGREVAKTTGIPFYERDIFLDNVKDVNAIVHQLKKTERVAQSKGWAIAIGHPYAATLAALKVWQDSRNRTIQVIPLSKLSPE